MLEALECIHGEIKAANANVKRRRKIGRTQKGLEFGNLGYFWSLTWEEWLHEHPSHDLHVMCYFRSLISHRLLPSTFSMTVIPYNTSSF